jgi:hypothetical protein
VVGTHERTTTIGDSELVTRHKAFHIINPDATTERKLSAWNRSCRVGLAHEPFLVRFEYARELLTHPLDTQLPQPSDLRGEHVGEVICLMLCRRVRSKLM